MAPSADVFFRLARPDASALVFLSVLLPLFTRTGDLRSSLENSFPLLLITICIYIVDHLDDIETDRINHPSRPLPSGQVSEKLVVVFYFACLALALVSTRVFVTRSVFLYYLLLIMGVNYQYVAEHLPNLKSTYVATATAIPILVLLGHFPEAEDLYIVAAAVFLFTLGKELCMDYLDRHGDPISFLSRMTTLTVGATAFSIQIVGIVLLGTLVASAADATAILTIVGLSCRAGWLWFARQRGSQAIAAMKLQLLAGLVFLL